MSKSSYSILTRPAENGRDSASAEPMPESGVSGKAGPKRKDLEREMRQVAARLRRDFADEIPADPKGFKKRATHYLKRYLPPCAGRPAEASITEAIRMRKEGRTWSEVYPLAIPCHRRLDPPVRRQAESNLRAAVRSRRNATKRRKRRRHSIAEANTSPNVPSRQELPSGPTLGAR